MLLLFQGFVAQFPDGRYPVGLYNTPRRSPAIEAPRAPIRIGHYLKCTPRLEIASDSKLHQLDCFEDFKRIDCPRHQTLATLNTCHRLADARGGCSSGGICVNSFTLLSSACASTGALTFASLSK